MKKILILAVASALTLSCSKGGGDGEQSGTFRILSNSLAQMNLKGSVKEMTWTEGGATTKYMFNESGNVVSITPGGAFIYDGNGRLTNFSGIASGSLNNVHKTVAITYGSHDKYIYVDELKSEEAHFSPFIKGVEKVVTSYTDEPSYTVTAIYNVEAGTITFTRTGDSPSEYTGTMTFEGNMPKKLDYQGAETFYFYYWSSGNLQRLIEDFPPVTETESFFDNKNNYLSESNTTHSSSGVSLTFYYSYDSRGNMQHKVYNTLDETFSYAGYDNNDNWWSRTSSSGPVTRTISYY